MNEDRRLTLYPRPRTEAGPALRLGWLAYVAFVVYGSLVPLDFQPRPWDEAWRLFQHIRLLDVGAQGRADWIANGVLYLPLAFLTAHALAGRRARPSALALVLALLSSLTLAVAVEFVQLHFPPRTVSLNDLLAEGIGSLLGVALAAAWGGRFRRMLGTLAGDPTQLALRIAQAYAVAYFAFSLFPYDFLVSGTELAMKAGSGAWGWLFAPDAWHGSLGTTLAKLLGEALAVAPLGYLAWRLRAAAQRWSAVQALGLGALLGLAIETAQFFLVSGLSQGLSILTRALGFYLGVQLARQGSALHPSRMAARVRRHLLAIVGLYLLALAMVNGWFEQRWLGMEHALRTLSELRFLPFYYHYYTTEQAALLSLTAVGLMYAPIGLLTWATWSPPALALVLGLLAAGLVEASKLFLEGLRPDPTNVLLAALAAWATAHLARRLALAARMSSRPAATAMQATAEAAGAVTRSAAALASPPSDRPRPVRDTPSARTGMRLRWPSWPGWALVMAGLALAAWGVATFPVQPLLLALLLGGYALLIWHHPQAMPVILPAALPLLDLAPWSGRFLFDEFDLMLLISVCIGYARLPPLPRRRRADPLLNFALILLGLAYAVGLARGLLPLQVPDANAWSHYYSDFNALRLAKGALWAFLLYGLLARLRALLPGADDRLALGMALGLAGTVAVVLWERLAFPGLLNFADVYRVTGPFSQMHTGGADLEAYLTLALPFLLYLMFTWRGWLAKTAGSLLLVAATYAMMVSYARIGYAAYAMAMLLTLALLWLARQRRAGGLSVRASVAMLTLAAVAVAVALPIWHGPFAQARLARSGADLDARIQHWQAALAMRDPGWATAAFGMGLGRYPQTHAWRAAGERAATYRLETEGGDRLLRLGAGSPLYVEHFVAVRPGQDYRLSLRLRSAQPAAALNLSLCEKWLLTSARCEFARVAVPTPGAWVPVEVHLHSGEVGNTPWYAPRPVKLSLYNLAVGTVIDVDGLSLRDEGGAELLANGDFSRGMDRWFFSVDNDLPWHIWSLPVHLLFEQGGLGLAAFAFFFALALVRSGRSAWRGDALAGALFASLAGFILLGSLDSLVDSPRMLMLGLLIAWLAARAGRPSDRA
jgi:VanZ family protein